MADKLGVTVDYFLYQVSTQAEVKAISVQLTDKDSEYVAFIGRLISTCNDYYGPEGRGFESLTAYQKSSKSSDFEDFCFS